MRIRRRSLTGGRTDVPAHVRSFGPSLRNHPRPRGPSGNQFRTTRVPTTKER